ncbi:MAG: alpha-N-acetylglucosaminidase, partial [Rikenellaceae bacterium]|nr:alpha-N-acetylglucosaminidase [Rikenellaceae bacterium]
MTLSVILRKPVTPVLLLMILFCSPGARAAVDLRGVERLVERRLPMLAGRVALRGMVSPDGRDVFRISATPQRLTVEASSPSAAAAGVNHYLERYCRMSLSRCGDNTGPLASLPAVADPETVHSAFRYRYALNYCTYNYTYAFYDWDDWQREIDLWALAGVNLMLAPLGTEELWRYTLEKSGFSAAQIRAFIPGPGFTAWWLMGNIEGWGGPMSGAMTDARTRMQQKILARMRELGIEPVLQGFWGMVPSSTAQVAPSADIREQGLWVHKFRRPPLLMPDDELFGRMAGHYYARMKQLYGKDIKFLGGDLFHEGGSTEGIDVERAGRLIRENMQRNVPGATWVLQGWSGNPKKELLAGSGPGHTLVIDLFGESGQAWRESGEFHGTPWIWATVNHFGGKTDMGGQLPVVVSDPHRALAESRGLLQGVGVLPEGSAANPVVYALALGTAWETGEPQAEELLREYLTARYGRLDDHAWQAWKLLLGSVYGEFALKGEGTYESVLCARPSTRVTNVSSWGPVRFQYDPGQLVRALALLRKAEPAYGALDTYRYDLTDLARQVLANHAREVYDKAMQSLRAGCTADYRAWADEFLHLAGLQDRLLATR